MACPLRNTSPSGSLYEVDVGASRGSDNMSQSELNVVNSY